MNRAVLLPLLLTFLSHFVWAQPSGLPATPITAAFSGQSLGQVLATLEDQGPFQIYAFDADLTLILPDLQFSETALDEVLDQVLGSTPLGHLYYRDHLVVVAPREALGEQLSAAYYQALQESLDVSDEEDSGVVTIGSVDDVQRTGETVIDGTVMDLEKEEPIIGATILILETQDGTASDDQGHFRLGLAPGSYTLAVQYIGYQNRELPIKVISSGSIEISMETSTVLLDEVVVEAKTRDENIRSVQVGVTRVSTKEIEKLPSFLGEVDIIKSLLLQPGVSSIGEGSGGFNVRGGNVDQNLIMIDEGILFNPSHALGFFSAFNSDILSDALLFKGNVPAKYGGRVASVLDLNVRNGNFEKLRLKGGLGPVSSRLVVEGPIAKEKTSALFALRSTYSDWILGQIKNPEIRESSVLFYDANLRLSHRFNDNNNLSLSAYYSKDKFTYANEFGFDYNTAMAQMGYRKVFGQKMLSTLSAIWSRYESDQLDLKGTDGSVLSISNEYVKIKENISYNALDFHADVGISGIYYRINPGRLSPRGPLSTVIPVVIEPEDALESAIYADAEWTLLPALSINAGLRYSMYRYFGPRDMYLYTDEENPTVNGILERVTIDKDVIFSTQNLEPRISARYRFDEERSAKAGYSRTSQYLNQISNNETPTPTNLWQLSNQYIPPNLSHNFTLGYFQNFDENIWITSLEVFYRHIDRLFDYRDFADLIANDHLETELLQGTGRAMGIELAIKRQVGNVSGWLNYTYARTERKIEGINQGQYYPASFDKPHDLSLVTNIHINKRSQISVNFNYSSGRPITIPLDRHFLEQKIVALNYSDRNAFRIPDYHRLDVSYTLGQGFRKSKKFKTSWTFSIYNLYGRRNAFSVFLEQESLGLPKIRRLSVLGSAFPSLTFNFELL